MHRDLKRIALVTDFGGAGPYVGQVKIQLAALAPAVPVIDLISDLVPFRPDLAAYLLPALMRDLPADTLYLCVVDPGVGGPREALIGDFDGRVCVGPDNGLFAPLARRARTPRLWRILWRPERLSASFHGRDLFAPVAARLASGERPPVEALDPASLHGFDGPEDLPRVIYADGYGNLMTGLRASNREPGRRLRAGDRCLERAATFCAVPPGQAFWYENALGLVEIAVNQGRADQRLGLAPGDPVWWREAADDPTGGEAASREGARPAHGLESGGSG